MEFYAAFLISITKTATWCYNNSMQYYLSRRAALKWLEVPSVYQIAHDELYELDEQSFRFLKNCASHEGCTSKDNAFTDYCMEEGLLTTEKVSARRPPLKQSPEPSLRYLELQITDACNFSCKHCYIGKRGGNELAPEQIRAVLTEFEEMQGLRVLITGGEPLLHLKFDQINEMLPDFFLRKVLFTNGALLKKENIRALKVDEIQVSMDGLEKAHDSVRGTGTFKRVMKTVHDALDAGLSVSISTMVHQHNLSDFDGMERLFKGMGIKDWTVDIPCASGRLIDNAEFHVSPEEGGKYLGYGYGGGLHSSTQGYGCGLHLMAVLADGKIAKCAFYGDQAVGAVYEGLRTTWHRIQPVFLKDLTCNCEYLEVCRGGCRYRAELIDGKGGKDLYRCIFYGII
jgi:radical SAM protein with 4Fe4S-binding SPASM domain